MVSLFGKLPPVPYDLSTLESRCTQIILSARKVWQVDDCWPLILQSSWPDPSEIDCYPTANIVAARILYGGREEASNCSARAYVDTASKSDLYKAWKNQESLVDIIESLSFGIESYLTPEAMDYDKIEEDVKMCFREFINKGIIDQSLDEEHAFAIRAIKISWITLGDILCRNALNLDSERIHQQILLAQEVLLIATFISPKTVETGRKHSKISQKGGLAKAEAQRAVVEATHADWQERANRIWKKHPTWKKSLVVNLISQETDVPVNTLRANIEKPS